MPDSDTSWQQDYAKLAIDISQETGYELPDNIYRIAGVDKPEPHRAPRWIRKMFGLRV